MGIFFERKIMMEIVPLRLHSSGKGRVRHMRGLKFEF